MRIAYVAEAEQEMTAAAEYLARATSSIETAERFLAEVAAAELQILEFPYSSPPAEQGRAQARLLASAHCSLRSGRLGRGT